MPKRILLLGAGRSASNLIKYLLENSQAFEWELTIVERSAEFVKKKIEGYSNACVIQPESDDIWKNEIPKHDLVISMLPARFHESVLSTLKSYELLKDPLVTDSVFRQGMSYKAIDIELYGVMENENIYYWHSAFESEEKFFEVVCWTRSMDRKQRYGADLEKIITGFKPLI